MEHCKVLKVRFFTPTPVDRDENRHVHIADKAAEVMIQWWDDVMMRYEKRRLYVSQARGEQFRDYMR